MKKALLITGMYLLIQLLAGVIISVYLIIGNLSAGKPIEATPALSPQMMLCALLITSILSFVLAILICRKGWKAPFTWNHTRSRTGIILFLSLLGTVPLAVFCNGLTEVFNLPDNMVSNFEQMSASTWALWIMALVGPVAEEVCFRYGIAGSLLEQNGCKPWVAIIVSALIFGLIHMNPAQMLGATVLGIYFAWLYTKTLSIWPSLLCHVFNNAMAVLLLRFLSKDFTFTQLMPSPSYMYLMLGASLLLMVPLLMLLNKAFKTRQNSAN